MPDITIQSVVRCSDEQLRRWADTMVQAYEEAKRFVAFYNLPGGVGALCPDTADRIGDNALADGRLTITGQQFHGAKTFADQAITWFETVVSGQTRITHFRRVAVNGAPRF